MSSLTVPPHAPPGSGGSSVAPVPAATTVDQLPGSNFAKSAPHSHKRNRQSCLRSDTETSGDSVADTESSSHTCQKMEVEEDLGLRDYQGAKKPREECHGPASMAEAATPKSPLLRTTPAGSDPEAAADSDSDSMYDDLDDFATPTDMDDYLDEGEDDCEDALSTTSTRTTMSTGSVGSNTPSLVGENLENFTLQGEQDKNKPSAKLFSAPLVKNTEPPLKRSLFSHVPPSINFVHHNEVPETPLPAELRKNLRWKLSNITPAVVKKVVTNSGYRLMRKTATDWGGTWGKHMKSYLFKDIAGVQKINHFPGTFNIGRKDRLWKNYQRLRVTHGKVEFNFLPRTFCLPADTKLLRKVWEKRGIKAKWIVKPPALARGNGIKVVNKWKDIPKGKPVIVQHYIAKPHLINQTKYDLRIYVLMTSLNPLRIYLYDEGLARFASNPYNPDNNSLNDVFMHLTNYSINKNSATYTPNDDPSAREGHKWTLASLWQHFAENGIDSKKVWDRIRDMVIKTLISAEHSMHPLIRSNLQSHYVGYELFGFDVLLDSELKPWLIEVNISPSLHSSSPLDLEVKSPLATEVFNIARYHVPNKISSKAQKQILAKLNLSPDIHLCFDPRLYCRDLSKADRAKHNRVVSASANRNEYIAAALDRLTPDDVRHLIRAEDELAQLKHFSRIFPTQETFKYFKFFQQSPPRYYNLLFDAWEFKYGDCRAAAIDRLERLCQEKVHLRVPSTKQIDVSVLKAPTPTAVVDATKDGGGEKANGSKSPSVEDLSTKSSAPTSPVKRLGVVSKPLHLKSNFAVSGGGKKLAKAYSAVNASSLAGSSPGVSSPEPMSVTSSVSKSRSPSPEVHKSKEEAPFKAAAQTATATQ